MSSGLLLLRTESMTSVNPGSLNGAALFPVLNMTHGWKDPTSVFSSRAGKRTDLLMTSKPSYSHNRFFIYSHNAILILFAMDTNACKFIFPTIFDYLAVEKHLLHT